MATQYEQQISSLKERAGEFADAHGASLVVELERHYIPLLIWLEYLRNSHSTGHANLLLDGIISSLRETAGCVSLGLIRLALFSMRGQIDLALAWMYFKDHPIEWQHINETGNNFKLKTEVLEYLNTYIKGFKARHALLKQVATCTETDTYKLLSAHIHAQSSSVLPLVNGLADIVAVELLAKECVALAGQTAEFIGDVFMAAFAGHWAGLPKPLIDSLNARFETAGQRKAFYEGI